jgi:hypothetical protein
MRNGPAIIRHDAPGEGRGRNIVARHLLQLRPDVTKLELP